MTVAGWLLLVLATQGGPTPSRPQMGMVVRPDTVRIGDPFQLIVRVRAPRGASIEFPTRSDSGGPVEALDPVVVVPTADTTAVEQIATYRLAAWDVGRLAIVLPDVIVRDATGERRLSLRGVFIHVASVLPADSAARVPKPPRDVLDVPPPWWWWLVLAAAIAALLLLVWVWWRHHRRERTAATVNPLQLADEAFDRIDRLGLVAAGERARHAALVVEVVRDYLARVSASAPAALTTSELLAAIRDERAIPSNALAALLTEADLVKFARKPIAPERALAIAKEARAMVHGIDAALPARTMKEAA